MLSEDILRQVQNVSYWKRPESQWNIDSWDRYYSETYPEKSRRKSHNTLGGELDVLIKNLEPKKSEYQRAFAFKRQLKISTCTRSRECGSVNEHRVKTHIRCDVHILL